MLSFCLILVHQEATEGEEEGRLLLQQPSHAGLEEKQGERGDAGGTTTSPAAPGDIVLASPVDTADVQLQLRPACSPQSTGPAGGLTVPERGEGAVVEAEAEAEGEAAPPCPLPRINPCLTVRGNTLYVYGGLLEVGEGRRAVCSLLRRAMLVAVVYVAAR